MANKKQKAITTVLSFISWSWSSRSIIASEWVWFMHSLKKYVLYYQFRSVYFPFHSDTGCVSLDSLFYDNRTLFGCPSTPRNVPVSAREWKGNATDCYKWTETEWSSHPLYYHASLSCNSFSYKEGWGSYTVLFPFVAITILLTILCQHKHVWLISYRSHSSIWQEKTPQSLSRERRFLLLIVTLLKCT